MGGQSHHRSTPGSGGQRDSAGWRIKSSGLGCFLYAERESRHGRRGVGGIRTRTGVLLRHVPLPLGYDPVPPSSQHGWEGQQGTMMKRIVVTGGAGFLGSHLCERLLDDGAEVICLDNFLTGTPANVSHLVERDGFRLIRADVTDFVHVIGESTPSCTSPRRRRRSTTSSFRSRPSRSARSARCTPSASRRRKVRVTCSPRAQKPTATPSSTRSPRRTGGMSTRSAHAVCTTRPSGSPRR